MDKGPQKSAACTLLDQWSQHTGRQSFTFTSTSPVKSTVWGATSTTKRKEIRQAWLIPKPNPLTTSLFHFPEPDGGYKWADEFPAKSSPWGFLPRGKKFPDSCSQGGFYQRRREQMASSLRSENLTVCSPQPEQSLEYSRHSISTGGEMNKQWQWKIPWLLQGPHQLPK